jgi:hypothetical protein
MNIDILKMDFTRFFKRVLRSSYMTKAGAELPPVFDNSLAY